MSTTPAAYTPDDRDSESLAAIDPDHSMIRKTQCSAAIALLRKWGFGLLDPDVEAHQRELPKNWWLIETPAVPVPEGAQIHFPSALVSARETLAARRERPLVIYDVTQESSVPKDEIFLNLWYYLSAEGHIVEPKILRHDGAYLAQLVATK